MGGRKCLSTILGPAPVWTKLATASMRFDKIVTDILTQYVEFQKNDFTSYGTSSYCTIIVKGPSRGGDLDCSIADASVSFVKSTIVSIVMVLLPCIWASIEESLCVTSEAYSSGGRSIGAKATVLFSSAISFLSLIAPLER